MDPLEPGHSLEPMVAKKQFDFLLVVLVFLIGAILLFWWGFSETHTCAMRKDLPAAVEDQN